MGQLRSPVAHHGAGRALRPAASLISTSLWPGRGAAEGKETSRTCGKLLQVHDDFVDAPPFCEFSHIQARVR